MNVVSVDAGSCEGWFTLYKAKAGDLDNKELVAGPFKNLITDQGLDRMGDNTSWLRYCQVGSGNDTPVVTDTALETFVAGTESDSSTAFSTAGIVTTPDYYAYVTIYYQFGVGAAAGNLSEIGVSWAATGSTLYSRALIVDGGGTPTTITILSDEILIVYYQWRVYPPTTDVTGTVTISGTNYDYTVRASQVATSMPPNNAGWGLGSNAGFVNTGRASDMRNSGGMNLAYTGTIGSITGSPGGTSTGGASVSNAAYVGSSLSRNAQQVWGIAITHNIRSVRYVWGWGSYQVQFDPIIPKTNINVFTIVLTHSWSRRTI